MYLLIAVPSAVPTFRLLLGCPDACVVCRESRQAGEVRFLTSAQVFLYRFLDSVSWELQVEHPHFRKFELYPRPGYHIIFLFLLTIRLVNTVAHAVSDYKFKLLTSDIVISR